MPIVKSGRVLLSPFILVLAFCAGSSRAHRIQAGDDDCEGNRLDCLSAKVESDSSIDVSGVLLHSHKASLQSQGGLLHSHESSTRGESLESDSSMDFSGPLVQSQRALLHPHAALLQSHENSTRGESLESNSSMDFSGALLHSQRASLRPHAADLLQSHENSTHRPAQGASQSPQSHEKFTQNASLGSNSSFEVSGALLQSRGTLLQDLFTLINRKISLREPDSNDSEAEESEGSFNLTSVILLALLGLCGAAGFFAFKNRKKLGKWRDFCPPFLKALLVKVGFDKFEAFNCHLVVHEVITTEKVETYIAIQAGEGEERSCIGYRGKSRNREDAQATIFEDVLTVSVPQGCDKIRLALVRKKNNDKIAELSISIKDIMKDKQETSHDYKMKVPSDAKKKSSVGDAPVLILSWSTSLASEMEEQPAILDGMDVSLLDINFKVPLERAARKWAAQLGPEKIKSMSFKEKSQLQLSLLAELVKGQLTEKSGLMGQNKKDYFYAIYNETGEGAEAKLGSWCFGWWEYNEETEERGVLVGSIPILNVSKVIAKGGKENEFILHYVKENDEGKMKEKDKEFISRNSNKDYWVHGMSAFIDHVRLLRNTIREIKEGREAGPGSPLNSPPGSPKGSPKGSPRLSPRDPSERPRKEAQEKKEHKGKTVREHKKDKTTRE